MKHKIILEDTVGSYGHDCVGNNWATFTLLGDNHTVTCTDCGKRINGGYQCDTVNETFYFCTSHVEIVQESEEKKRLAHDLYIVDREIQKLERKHHDLDRAISGYVTESTRGFMLALFSHESGLEDLYKQKEAMRSIDEGKKENVN